MPPPKARPARFSIKAGQIFDAGVKITPQELEGYLRRQEQALANNSKQGEFGVMANRLIQPEYDQALELFRSLTLSPAGILPQGPPK